MRSPTGAPTEPYYIKNNNICFLFIPFKHSILQVQWKKAANDIKISMFNTCPLNPHPTPARAKQHHRQTPTIQPSLSPYPQKDPSVRLLMMSKQFPTHQVGVASQCKVSTIVSRRHKGSGHLFLSNCGLMDDDSGLVATCRLAEFCVPGDELLLIGHLDIEHRELRQRVREQSAKQWLTSHERAS